MSDMSSLSHEYASATDFSRQINDAVLLLKKRYLRKDVTGIDAQRLKDAGDLIHQTVQTLLRRLGDEPTANGDGTIPDDVLARIEAKHQGNLNYFKQDLAKVDQAFVSGAALGPVELELLDSICEAADASASATFRKLWRR
jgi:hypothetical protein